MHRITLSEWGNRSLGEFLLQDVNSGPAVSQDEPQSLGMHRISEHSSALAVFRKKTLSSYRIGSWQCSDARARWTSVQPGYYVAPNTFVLSESFGALCTLSLCQRQHLHQLFLINH